MNSEHTGAITQLYFINTYITCQWREIVSVNFDILRHF